MTNKKPYPGQWRDVRRVYGLPTLSFLMNDLHDHDENVQLACREAEGEFVDDLPDPDEGPH